MGFLSALVRAFTGDKPKVVNPSGLIIHEEALGSANSTTLLNTDVDRVPSLEELMYFPKIDERVLVLEGQQGSVCLDHDGRNTQPMGPINTDTLMAAPESYGDQFIKDGTLFDYPSDSYHAVCSQGSGLPIRISLNVFDLNILESVKYGCANLGSDELSDLLLNSKGLLIKFQNNLPYASPESIEAAFICNYTKVLEEFIHNAEFALEHKAQEA